VSDSHRRLSRREVYRNPWLAVEAHRIVHPSGVRGEHLLVVTPQACGVVVEDRGELLFTRQARFAAQKQVTEIVKGGSDPGELPLDAAKRELREELGITAGSWSPLGTLYEIPSIVEPPIVLFLARELEYAAPDQSDEEGIALVRLEVGAALGAAASGELDDAVTLAALFRFAALHGHIALLPGRDSGPVRA
jgi:8-oxo-dGTP pyrophosphatase MutT (NUDIX family)